MDKALDPVIEAPLVYPGEAESAKGYAVRAETAADRAEAVVGGLDSLQGLVDAAAASAQAAGSSAAAAGASETASKGSEDAAAASATAAAESAADANASEVAASESASAAAESKSAAADSAKAAKDSADGATTSASSAGQSAENAARAMQNAGNSASSAKGDAEKSAASAAAAAKSASDAQGYMQTASSAATDANTSAENAAGSKAAVASSATAAAGSATAAAGNAKTASDAAAEATGAKTAAVAAQKDAAASKAAAANSAAAAKTSEDAAAKSAADADSTANSINNSRMQIAANKEAVSQLKEDTTALQKRQNVLVGSETGNPISCDDAFAAPLCGLNVYGKSTQGGTPSPDNPVPIVSAGDDGSVAVRVTGKNLLDDGIIPSQLKQLVIELDLAQNKTYTLSSSLPNRNDGGTFLFFLRPSEKVNTTKNGVLQGKPVTLTTGSDGKALIQFSNTDDTGISDFKAYWYQLELGTTATAYSPYREQLLTMSTPNGLPGIPVTSGGNYTDPQGQQWVCDEVDFERSILIRRIYSEIYTGAERWLQNNSGIFLALSEAARDALKGTAISNIAVPCSSHPELSDSKPVGIRPTASGKSIGFFFANNAQPTLDDWKTALSKTNARVQYVLQKPIESKLTDAELAAYKALTAYAPDTVVQASDGAGVKLEYQRDVNIAIKKLEDAIASMTTT